MNTAVASRGMKANDILDLAFDMGLERPKIATAGEWDGGRVHILTYGPLAYRRTMEIPSPAMRDHVTQMLAKAKEPAQPIVEQILEQRHCNVVPTLPAKQRAKRASKVAP